MTHPGTDAHHQWTGKEILATLARHHDRLQAMGVLKIGLFGSYRRGTPTSGSDMDFLITLEEPSFDGYVDVKLFLKDLFQCEVDPVLERTPEPRLRPYMLAEVEYALGP